MHTWDVVGLRTRIDMVEKEWDGKFLVSNHPLWETQIESIWHPTTFVCDDQAALLPTLQPQLDRWYERRNAYIAATGDVHIKRNRCMSNLFMWYSWKRANELRQAYEQEQGLTYDIVYRTRPDFCPNTSLPWDDDTIISPPYGGEGLHDWWMTGPAKYIDVLSSLYDHLDELWAENLQAGPTSYEASLNPHKLPWRHLVKHGIPFVKWDHLCGIIGRSPLEM